MIDKFFSSIIFEEFDRRDRDIEKLNENKIIEQPKYIDYSNSNRIEKKSESNERSKGLNIRAFSCTRFALLIIEKIYCDERRKRERKNNNALILFQTLVKTKLWDKTQFFIHI